MRHPVYFFLCVILLIASCSNIENNPEESAGLFPIVTKSQSEIDYSVTRQDVEWFLHNQAKIQEINCYPSEEDPTLFIAKCDSGFYILSADKRACPVVAYSDNGFIENFDDEAYHEFEKYILDEYSAPIRQIQYSTSINSEMAINIQKWGNPIEAGKYLPAVKSTRSSSIGPLLETTWGQSDHYTNDHYWNNYCPWSYSSCTGSKSPVGCVAVAGGQFGYYMRDMSGVVIRIPTEASCYGYVNNYTRYFSDQLSISLIDEMPLNYSNTTAEMEHARLFLAYIGECVGMTYGATSSGAYTGNLTTLFDIWGIDSDYITFSDSLAINQLSLSIPVVTRGAQSSSSGGHCWIIDGYTLVPNAGYQFYHMNWGWNGSYDGWFSTGNWVVAGYNFSYGKHMIKVN